MTGYLEELRVRAKQYGMTDVPERLDCIVEAVIYGFALPAYAREEIDLIWIDNFGSLGSDFYEKQFK